MKFTNFFNCNAADNGTSLMVALRILGIDFAIAYVKRGNWTPLTLLLDVAELSLGAQCWFLTLFVGRDNNLYPAEPRIEVLSSD